MGSTRPTDRSIGEATFLPQWMKGKSDTRFDFSDGTFSPPADDTFFLIRYPKPSAPSASREGFRSISDFLGGKRETNASETTATTTDQQLASFDALAGSSSSNSTTTEPKLIYANKSRPKPLDDEFCAGFATESGRGTRPAESNTRTSIVSVASQIMFGKVNNLAPNSDAAGQQQPNSDHETQRKGSKSLPASPLTSPHGTPDSSPRSRRRAYGNRFFTGAFVPGPDGAERQKNGWLLGSILGQSREFIAPKIEEEDEQQLMGPEHVPARALSRKKSISSQNLTYFGKEDKQTAGTSSSATNTTTSTTTASSSHSTGHVLQAQPSELREMNFWSPTSM